MDGGRSYMMDWLIIAGYSMSGAMLAMMSIGIVFSAFMPALDRWNRRYFIVTFSLLFLYAVALFIDLLIYNNPTMAATQKVVSVVEYLFFSVLTPMPVPLLLHRCGENLKNSVLLRVIMMLWAIFCFMLLGAQFTDVFYSITSDNQYLRGSWLPLLLVPMSLITIVSMGGLIRRRKKLSKRFFMALLFYLLPTTILIVVYMFSTVDMVVPLWMALCALTMLEIILRDNMEQYMRQQREIANQYADIMVLQMRPHFIYNTMMGIYYLCEQDPKKAKQVTLDFTAYLRKNFSAIARKDTIPFHDELEHTRAYLAVEQAQFEDVLFVHFDTPHTLFRVPPLTLQPIVENAVKHGMKSSNAPIHISVITRRTDTSSEIIVEDDGSGFDPVADNEPHIALDNIRHRLELMCGGTLTIEMREGGGTLVKVSIPMSDH